MTSSSIPARSNAPPRRGGWLLVSLALLSWASGCGDSRALLAVDLYTDLGVGEDFDTVRIRLRRAGAGEVVEERLVPALADWSFATGARVTELPELPPGDYELEGALLHEGEPVLSRELGVALRGDMVASLVMTRACLGVECPRAGDPADHTECSGGVCVPETCDPERPEACAGASCEDDGDCAAEGCLAPACLEGRCYALVDHEACSAGELCGPDGACVAESTDGGTCEDGASCDTGRACEIGRMDCSSGVPTCVAAGVKPAGTSCRTAAGPCDVEEQCDGIAATCPPDELRARGFVCRRARGECDLPEGCDGSSPDCPADRLRGSSHECRAAAGACDRAESCTGGDPECPPDDYRTPVYRCRAAAGECDVPEHCTGDGPDCPADAFAEAGTACDDGDPCTGADRCGAEGVCVGRPECGPRACERGCFPICSGSCLESCDCPVP